MNQVVHADCLRSTAGFSRQLSTDPSSAGHFHRVDAILNGLYDRRLIFDHSDHKLPVGTLAALKGHTAESAEMISLVHNQPQSSLDAPPSLIYAMFPASMERHTTCYSPAGVGDSFFITGASV